MPPPVLFPCGGVGQPACPPQPADKESGLYTADEMRAHGSACYAKGLADAAQPKEDLIGDEDE